MNVSTLKNYGLILAHALIVWAACGAVMFAGMAFTSITAALAIHLLAAPIIAALVARFYFTHFHFNTPLSLALSFTFIVIFMDVFIVALLIERSFNMFGSLWGTWVPFTLIFTATYLTGRRMKPGRKTARVI